MKPVKVVTLDVDQILFDNGTALYSSHQQDCCEQHYLDFSDLSLEDFEKLEFDISNEKFFERIDGYGIALKPIHGHPVRIPGYGSNSGYYSSELILVVEYPDKTRAEYDISECQDISY